VAESPYLDPFQVAIQLCGELESRNVPYALGGAMAFGAWSETRATKDVDINVFLEPDQLETTFEAIESIGVAVDRDRARADAAEGGMFVVWAANVRLDVFTPSIAFSWEAFRTRVRGNVQGRALWILSAEAISIFKMLFFRSKDLVDLERLVAVQREHLDHAYVRRHLVEMMGEDDERVRKWDALVAEFGHTPS
jgi:hypothetical protein